MQTNSDKITALRRDITAQIVALMKENNLTEIEFDEAELEYDPTYVLWQANNGEWFESVVKRVSIADGTLEFYCDDENGSAILGSVELACNRSQCLEELRQQILRKLDLEDTFPTPADRLKLLHSTAQSINDEILQTMYDLVEETPEQELEGRMKYLTCDEDRDKCCIVGFEARGETLIAVLEYEFTGKPRRIPVRSLNMEEAMSAMLSMLK